MVAFVATLPATNGRMPSRVTVQSLVNGLADRLGSPVILEDADQQLVAYSPHYVADEMRQQTILRRTTAQPSTRTIAAGLDLPTRPGPFVVEADPEQNRLARLCIPVRFLESILGYAWVLLPDGEVDEATMALAAAVAEEISFTLLADSRTRASESDTVMAVVSPDSNTRFPGLIDIESRSGFDESRMFLAAVCTGPDWRESDTRGSFWTAAWAMGPQHQLRGTSSSEGVAIVSVSPSEVDSLEPIMHRAFGHTTQHRRETDLAVGYGGAVGNVADLHESCRQARLAARAALRSPDLGPVAGWDQLGIHRFLTQLPRDVLQAAVDPRLQQVAAKDPIILETLDCYLRHSGAISAVADALHIHRTTLYYRLSRLREFGIEPNDGGDRMAMGSGIAAMRLLSTYS